MTQTQLTVSRRDFERIILDDPYADASYLEQDGFEGRWQQMKDGEFSFVGVYATVEIRIPDGDSFILQTIRTPGLWGIESDSDDYYLDEVYREECRTLAKMLETMGMKVVD